MSPYSVYTMQPTIRLSCSKITDNRRTDADTKRLHIVRMHFVRKRGQIHYRRRVPSALHEVLGRKEIWKSLGTDSLTVAKRRALRVAAQIEQEFEIVPLKVGLIVDPVVLEPFVEQAEVVSAPVVVEA